MGLTNKVLVSIYFEEEEINQLFSELLRSKGVKTRVLGSLEELSGATRIVTEPQYFPQLPSAYKGSCLLVGNKESLKGLSGVHLPRPLTESKVESAIDAFLA